MAVNRSHQQDNSEQTFLFWFWGERFVGLFPFLISNLQTGTEEVILDAIGHLGLMKTVFLQKNTPPT